LMCSNEDGWRIVSLALEKIKIYEE
jgi:hypothetical protein